MAKLIRKQENAVIRFALTSFLIAVAALMSANTAQAETIYSDNFMGATLNPSWHVLPGNGSYTVGGGQLRYFNEGPVSATTGWYNSALTLALPFSGTDWEIDLKATYNLNYLFPNGNSTGAQGPLVAVKFNPSVTTSSYGGADYAGTDYAGFERDVDACTGCTPANLLEAWYGTVRNDNLINPADAGTPPPNDIGDGTYWYQIVRNGGALTINVSYDGVHWITGISASLADPTDTYNELLLGGNTYLSAGSYTDYSYVDITRPTATPEPASLILLGTGLMFLGWLVRRRNAACH